ncbi:MAG: cytidylate kinase-like family protein [Bacteroidales bacterium]|nr:cytidylate kinase-like family protein [Bacteroidales bacterium]MCF8454378.1 cytidylate kinase-like family protein [Bacteroidales bacterium]
MDNLLIDYFHNRMERTTSKVEEVKEPGPVITLSRDYGCPGKRIATLLVERIKAEKQTDWTMISKEILETLATELKLNPSVVNDIAHFEDRGLGDYLALLLSKDYYPGEQKIKNTLSEIILSFAKKGHTIIVGRAGIYITKQIEKSYHIKLFAPIEWRIDYMSAKMSISYPDAMRLVEDMSRKREQFLKFFAVQKKEDITFDATFDCSQVSDDEIISHVMADLEKKGIV